MNKLNIFRKAVYSLITIKRLKNLKRESNEKIGIQSLKLFVNKYETNYQLIYEWIFNSIKTTYISVIIYFNINIIR
jgi:hypothetical protein